mmetsp:Transcript_1084/g.3576  ORF Transcript_1084/g.3576 Transcript_1084/m.3576 type:complete len:276 (-) Transcript_1084:12-839(-)
MAATCVRSPLKKLASSHALGQGCRVTGSRRHHWSLPPVAVNGFLHLPHTAHPGWKIGPSSPPMRTMWLVVAPATARQPAQLRTARPDGLSSISTITAVASITTSAAVATGSPPASAARSSVTLALTTAAGAPAAVNTASLSAAPRMRLLRSWRHHVDGRSRRDRTLQELGGAGVVWYLHATWCIGIPSCAHNRSRGASDLALHVVVEVLQNSDEDHTGRSRGTTSSTEGDAVEVRASIVDRHRIRIQVHHAGVDEIRPRRVHHAQGDAQPLMSSQ